MHAFPVIALAFGRNDDAAFHSQQHLLGGAAALVAGVVWIVICVLCGWPLFGISGIALGLIVGGALCAALRAHSGPLAGVLAVAVAVSLLFVGAALQRGGDRQQVLTAAQSDASLIAAIAEQIVWERSTPPSDDAQPTAATATPIDVHAPPAGIAPTEIPAAVQLAAMARWQAMSAEEKQQLRDQRRRWMIESHGRELEHLAAHGAQEASLAVLALVIVAALLAAAWPALVARYLGKDE